MQRSQTAKKARICNVARPQRSENMQRNLPSAGALPATRATARPPVAGGEEREEGKRPSELRVPPLLANPQLSAETKL